MQMNRGFLTPTLPFPIPFIYSIIYDQWISPVVTGDRPPPIDDFTLTPVTNNTAVMFGGFIGNEYSNKLYMISFTKTSVDILEVPNPGGSVQWPNGRYGHSSVLITTSSGPHLLVVGGSRAYDVWLLDINKRKWKELINLPDNVTNRHWHSLSVWSMTPTTNWIIIQQDRDKEQQQLLQEKATLSQQLDYSTNLLEQAEKDKSSLELEYNEKLKAKVADIEEKKQIIT
uniref:Uncharacterized protein n=1 Tax=Amphimedon queenslandica TaxID=400682 RepID=A0A1X7UWG3_AMPQE